MTDKLCKDCVHSVESYYSSELYCVSPKVTKPDLVRGGRLEVRCEHARTVEFLCGSYGVGWEEKPAPEPKLSVIERLKNWIKL